MTTVIQRIEAKQGNLKPGKAIKTLYALPAYILGGIAGGIWWSIRLWWTALVTGFEDVSGERFEG